MHLASALDAKPEPKGLSCGRTCRACECVRAWRDPRS